VEIKRIAPLDGLRTFAVFGVVWIHSWTSVGNPTFKFCAIDIYRLIAILGNGVNFFFVISGFFMYQVLSKKEFSIKNYRVFILRRCKRIAPAFYFSAVCYAVYFYITIGPQYPIFKYLLINFLFLNNNFSHTSVKLSII
jgi:peptidoglycan/LPS O-acetylase OafA/YrhL